MKVVEQIILSFGPLPHTIAIKVQEKQYISVSEKGLDGREGNAEPLMKAPLPEQARHLKRLLKEAAELNERRLVPVSELEAARIQWEQETTEELAERWSPLELDSIRVEKEEGRQERFVHHGTARTPLTGITALRLELSAGPGHQVIGGVIGNVIGAGTRTVRIVTALGCDNRQ